MRCTGSRKTLHPTGRLIAKTEGVTRNLIDRERTILVRSEQVADAGFDAAGAAAHAVSVIILRSPEPPSPPRAQSLIGEQRHQPAMDVTLCAAHRRALQCAMSFILERYSPHGFIQTGGMMAVEQEAAAEAIRDARESWLPTLESFVAEHVEEGDLITRFILDEEIRRLRRLLGQPAPQSPEDLDRRRQQTRERVRRYRERQRATNYRNHFRHHERER
jgi:hypothetical protein